MTGFFVVGITDTCERLAFFNDEHAASEFIGTLVEHEDGRYFLDGPCENVILEGAARLKREDAP